MPRCLREEGGEPMLRTMLLAVALATTGLLLAPVASAEDEVPTCQSTLDNPPSRFSCDAGPVQAECVRIEGGYRCDVTTG
jgi:hypothetical protein